MNFMAQLDKLCYRKPKWKCSFLNLKYNRIGKCCNKWSDAHWSKSNFCKSAKWRGRSSCLGVSPFFSRSCLLSSRTFCPTKPAKSLHTQKNRQFFFEPEDNFWIVMVSLKAYMLHYFVDRLWSVIELIRFWSAVLNSFPRWFETQWSRNQTKMANLPQ